MSLLNNISWYTLLIHVLILHPCCIDKNMYMSFDLGEFRSCLEKLNVQFDDVQCLALFAYFDDDNDG
jgi:hypothetical protein